MRYLACLSFGLIFGLASGIAWSQDTDSPMPGGESGPPQSQEAGGDEPRVLLGGPIQVSPEDLVIALERVIKAISPVTVEELAAPAPDTGMSVGNAGISMPMRIWTRDDGVRVTIMSAQQGPDSAPTNVGVWHSTESGGGGLAALVGGNAGRLVLRLHEPTTEPAAQPFGFLRVRLFEAGVEEEYSLESGKWMMRRFEAAEQSGNRDAPAALINAAGKGHTAVVENLIARGAAINARGADGSSALVLASYYGHLDVVTILLTANADVDIQSNDGRTALMVAAGQGHSQIVRSLLDRGADMSLRDTDGDMALHYAKTGEIAQLLIDRGAVVAAQNVSGDTALSKAAERGRLDVVSTLLASGAPADLGSSKGKTPLNNAAWEGHTDIVQLLLAEGATVDLRTADGANALLLASAQGHLDVVEILLAAKSPTDAHVDDGRTALILATTKGHPEVVRALVRNGANTTLRDENGGTALHYAKSADPVQLLIDGGADVDARNKHGHTALAYAAAGGHLDAVAALMANGATIDAQGNDGRTALMLAANRGHGDIVGVLLQGGADVSLQDSSGGTALSYAKSESIEGQLSADSHARWKYSDGEEALLRADFDQAVAIFQELAAAGDKDAEAAAAMIMQLSEDDRTQWIIEQGAEAVRVGNLDEAERLFSIAVERGHHLAPQLLDVVLQTQKKVAPIDKKIERLQAEAGFQCRTTLSMDGNEVLATEDCPEGAPQALIDKHRQEVRAAIENVREYGFAKSASTIVTGAENSGSVSWGQRPASD